MKSHNRLHAVHAAIELTLLAVVFLVAMQLLAQRRLLLVLTEQVHLLTVVVLDAAEIEQLRRRQIQPTDITEH